MLDPPDHTDVPPARRARVHAPPGGRASSRRCGRSCVERLERLATPGGGDIVAELFKPLPSMVVAHYLGVPEEDRDRFDGWTEAIVAANAAGRPARRGRRGRRDVRLLRRADRAPPRASPATTPSRTSSRPASATTTRGLLSILGYVFTMVTGGNDTTTGMLGGAVQLLDRAPRPARAARRRPGADPRRGRGAAAAHLAGAGPGPHRHPRRRAARRRRSRPAARSLLLYGAANRDPRAYGPTPTSST